MLFIENPMLTVTMKFVEQQYFNLRLSVKFDSLSYSLTPLSFLTIQIKLSFQFCFSFLIDKNSNNNS